MMALALANWVLPSMNEARFFRFIDDVPPSGWNLGAPFKMFKGTQWKDHKYSAWAMGGKAAQWNIMKN